MKKAYVLVEGHGEVLAMQNLVSRLSHELHLYLPWSHPIRWKNLHQWDPITGKHGVRRGAEFVRNKRDIGALLIVLDNEDGCPAVDAPALADLLRGLVLPFPVAFVQMYPEYEVLFLPCLKHMPGFGHSAARSWGNVGWEARRGIKEWLSQQLPTGRRYKPTVDQLEMTRRLVFSELRSAEVACFGSLERGIAFLRDHLNQPGTVYPSPPITPQR